MYQTAERKENTEGKRKNEREKRGRGGEREGARDRRREGARGAGGALQPRRAKASAIHGNPLPFTA